VQRTVSLGFNCVRLPFSLQLLYEDPVVPEIALVANAGLKGIRAMALFGLSIKRMADAGLIVVLNNHNSAARLCCAGSSEEGMWHTSKYPMQACRQKFEQEIDQRHSKKQTRVFPKSPGD